VTVNFTNTTQGPVNSALWTFGDGGTSTSTNLAPAVSHTFTVAPGCVAATNYVVLAVTNTAGTSIYTNPAPVVVYPVAPTPSFTWSPPSPLTNQVVAFHDTTANPSGCGYTRQWSFGDGNSSTAASPFNIYTTVATNLVTLVITTTGYGVSATSQQYLVVGPVAPSASQGSPRITKLAVVNLTNLLVIGTNTPASYTRPYNILRSNTVTAARSQWPIVASGAFAANGGFTNTITNAVSGPKQFFLIQVP